MSLDKISPIAPLRPLDSIEGGQAPGTAKPAIPFGDLLSKAMGDVAEAQTASSQDAVDLVMGNESDLHSIMIRAAMETTAIETAVEITSRAVGAYKEIMQMQI